ncbi:hypothetical protein I215_09316 [Galbibacter marinus]|uniref:Uncharacterized protein n=1 Tax=Galbibacter marinus TaxID=555500 RepID=K2PR62_9FLAO|nr:hypothetical protein I215_09316 [Galbibacter marinus]
MNITGIIINRLLFRFAPIITLLVCMLYYELISFDNFFNILGFLFCILIVIFVYYFYDLIKHFNKVILRKKILQQAKLQGIPADIALPRKLNFLDKRLSTKYPPRQSHIGG